VEGLTFDLVDEPTPEQMAFFSHLRVYNEARVGDTGA
jgi:hypothetical protein